MIIMDYDNMAYDFILGEGSVEQMSVKQRLQLIHDTVKLISPNTQRDKRWIEVIRSQARRAMTQMRQLEREQKELEEEEKREK